MTTTKIKPGRYSCDKQCIGWKTYNICAHCVAAAEDNKELDGCISWFVSSKGKEHNLTKAAYHDTYQHAGLKKPHRRKYGDAQHLPTVQKTEFHFVIFLIPFTNTSTAVHNNHLYTKCHATSMPAESKLLNSIQAKHVQLDVFKLSVVKLLVWFPKVLLIMKTQMKREQLDSAT